MPRRIPATDPKPPPMHAAVNIALRAARDAVRALDDAGRRLDRIRIVADEPGRLVTSADEAADGRILQSLRRYHPSHAFRSRVSGSGLLQPATQPTAGCASRSGTSSPRGDGGGDALWLIDPLAGGANFLAGRSPFCVALALRLGGVTKHAVLLCPATGDEFCASRGAGAQLNGRRIRAERRTPLERGLLGLSPEGLDPSRYRAVEDALRRQGLQTRLSGCPPADMADAAAGRLAGGWCAAFCETSRSAAELILLEAGGLAGTENGDPRLAEGSEILFGGPKTFRRLLRARGEAAR